jgi:HEPN domain-containing protein
LEPRVAEIVNKWILKAEHDLKAADQMLRADEPITDAACFHCQQAVEKYLKAYLVSRGVAPEKTHKLERLIEECSKWDKAFISLAKTVVLSEYAVESRYPDDFFIPSLDEANRALALAREVKQFLVNRF